MNEAFHYYGARAWRSIVFGAGLLALSAACSKQSEPPNGGLNGGGLRGSAGGGSAGGAGPCTEGTTQPCTVHLGEHNGVNACFVGTQRCTAGQWGPCTDGSSPPQGGSGGVGGTPPGPLAYSASIDCQNNPCDPTCQCFDEGPAEGLQAEPSGPSYSWETGSLSDLPPGLLNKGFIQPCSAASDCQFNHRCENPTSNSCAHSKCVVGDGLEDSCDPCVQTICTSAPSCCQDASSCEQLYGSAPNFVDCVQTSTECHFRFRNTEYSCEQICAQAGGSCIDMFDNSGNCGIDPQDNPGCDYIGYNSAICMCTRPGGGGAWTSDCVDMVRTHCGAFCDNDDQSGQCVPWLPGETNDQCAGIDLTVGVPCADGVPVCNVGNTAAPAGVELIHFPANSQQYPQCEPNQSHPQMQSCTTAEAIEPGLCITLTGCPGLNGNREIMVNPPDLAQVVECHDASCANNWSLYSDGPCGVSSCSGASSQASFKPVNLTIMVDKSGSMGTNGMWTPAMNAIKAFFQDPESAGMNVALRFYPDDAPSYGCSSPTCSIDACAEPLVGLGQLTADPAPADGHEQSLVSAIDSRSPGGTTPTYTALAGAEQWAAEYTAAHPEQQQVVIIVTDGYPNRCNDGGDAAIVALAADGYDDHGVLTYAIGLEGASQVLMDDIAAAGGTTAAFFVSNNNQVEEQLLAALQAIRGQAVICSFDLPNPGTFDPASALVTYRPGQGPAQVLSQQADVAGCGDGWYYDDNENPIQIILCPSSCGLVQSDEQARIDVELGCPGVYEPATYTELYEAVCPPQTRIQWGYFTYETETPGDSQVSFVAHTADSEGQLQPPLIQLATAQAAPDTQSCPMWGPEPCPIDLYELLGGEPDAHRAVLELVITVNPTSGGAASPTVHNWQLTYSCPDNG